MAHPKGANPPKPATQGGLKGAHVQKPATSGRPKATEAPTTKQDKRGFHPGSTRGTGKGAH